MSLGELERLVLEVLWDAPDSHFTVGQVANHFPDHAYTTIMTVMTRLTKKGFLIESKKTRAHQYQVTATRDAYLSTLMTEVLRTAHDRDGVLASFARNITASDAAALRKFLGPKRN